MFGSNPLSTSDVFGISTDILEHSYVDRGEMDEEISRILRRDTHLALRGESKCGKSWLRQKNIPDAITVQCRLNKTVRDLYTDALSQLGLRLVKEKTSSTSFHGKLESTQEIGLKILAKLSATESGEIEKVDGITSMPVGRDLDDLRFVSEIINASGRRLVIEDFHYLSPKERKSFAFDLKALWDYKTYVVVIGIWSENNLLIHLNSDLSLRITEVSIYWSTSDLCKVLDKGSKALNISFGSSVKSKLVEDAFGTVGILQTLTLGTLDESKIFEQQKKLVTIDSMPAYEGAAMKYADQLNALYQTFAKRVAGGIRQRRNSTGIYAHMLHVVLSASDKQLTDGLHTDEIFRAAHAREPRVQKPNLRQILEKIDGIQIDEDGRGLILSYDQNKDEVFVVDKQLFLYRKYATVRWPWENLIEQADAVGDTYQPDNDN